MCVSFYNLEILERSKCSTERNKRDLNKEKQFYNCFLISDKFSISKKRSGHFDFATTNLFHGNLNPALWFTVDLLTQRTEFESAYARMIQERGSLDLVKKMMTNAAYQTQQSAVFQESD